MCRFEPGSGYQDAQRNPRKVALSRFSGISTFNALRAVGRFTVGKTAPIVPSLSPTFFPSSSRAHSIRAAGLLFLALGWRRARGAATHPLLMMRSPYPVSDVLVVLTKEPQDFHLAQTQQWYRIPTSTRLPACLRQGTTRFLAFYFPQAFKSSGTASATTRR